MEEEARARIEHVEVLDPIQKLRQIQEELQKVNEESQKEISAIVHKFMKDRNEMYKKRNMIISKIPCFWFTAFMHNSTLQNLLKEEDREIFCYLESMNVEDFTDPRRGYYIAFNFRTNPIFHNRILTKTISFLGDGILRSIGTTIDWKAGRGPSDAGNDANRRPLPFDSFFSWFSSPEEDEMEVEKDLVAEIIKEEIWPNPIHGLLSIDVDQKDEDEDEDGGGNH
ncbi:hypothetical protein C2S53_007586 [Perilla frutescens var. hirtella]|uniref:Uncharacterized protein n=1 Tax=Perilla frutescens var. hirtella TaxID=608512 RepID=A0AAD4JAV8_PERFH|nr:hypothetical protein C2S53_007586 [Perilla frutescens var. hirtella]